MSTTSPLRSYRPGSWFAILGEVVTVALPASEKRRVAALWELVDAGSTWDELLDVLLDTGLRALPGFVLLGHDGGGLRVLVRGAAVVRVTTAGGDSEEIDGSAALTWAERSFGEVASLTLLLDESDGDDLVISTGLVRVARIDAPPRERETQAPPEAEPEVEPTYDESPESEPEPEPEAMPEPEPTPEPAVLDEQPTEMFPALAEPVVEEERPVSPVWETPPVWGKGPGAVVAPDPDPEVPAAASPLTDPLLAPMPSVAPVAVLSFSSGEVIEVDRAILVGRAPEARRFASTEQPMLVTVPSRNQEISSTHLEIRPGSDVDLGTAIVTDLGSTNGTVLVRPGAGPEDLQPGIPVHLVPGSIIDLGDGITISVTAP
ncbi:FHA domain-containing protein [Nocardioides sp.]|uniref:FHA domain-containing protein n=1 Tax=Nocardioides sp. TaxID=35761 RepID=UPI003D116089